MRKFLALMLVLALVLTMASFPAFADAPVVSLLGANIRLESADTPAGIRFGATIDKASAGIDGNYVYSEENDVKFGMYLLPSDLLGEAETLADYIAEGGDKALDIPAKKIYAQDDESLTYTAVVTGIPEKGYARELVAVPYVVAGGSKTFHAEAKDSYVAVAQKAVDSYNNGNPNNLSAEDVLALEEIVEIADSNEEPAGPALITGITVTGEGIEADPEVNRPLSNIVDGISGLTTWNENYSNFYLSTPFATAGDGTTPVFTLTFDLGAKYDVESFFIGREWNGAEINNATLYGSNDLNGEWTELKTGIATAWGPDFGGGNYYYTELAASYQYFKLDVTQLSEATFVRIHEVEFIGTPAPAEEPTPDEPTPDEPGAVTEQKVALTEANLTIKRTFDSGWVGTANFANPGNLFDSDYTTYSDWDQYRDDATTADMLADFIIDLGAVKNISKVVVSTGADDHFGPDWWSNAAPMNATISVSADGVAYTPVYTYDSDTAESQRVDSVELDYTTDGAGIQFVKYTFNKVARRATIAEIEVYEMVASEGGEGGGNEPGETPDPEVPTPEVPAEPALITGITVTAEGITSLYADTRPYSIICNGVSGEGQAIAWGDELFISAETFAPGDGSTALFSLTFDLGKKYDVSRFFVGIGWDTGDITAADLYGSNDGGATWTLVKSGMATAWSAGFDGGDMIGVNLTGAVYQMFKLDVKNVSKEAAMQIHEIEFTGVPDLHQ